IIDDGDDTKYSCPASSDESGLSQEDLDEILNGGSGGNNGSGIINGNYNRGNSALGDNPFSFSTGDSGVIGGDGGNEIERKVYQAINDNDFFGGCETFFCITIEYLTHDGNLLIGGTTRSIESIMERSNNHLKKFANSSLVQSKMTTNNFELGLRDLNLSDIFSMPIVIIKKHHLF
ncbi:MAG: hypothetical protein Q9M97_09200, partial [Candidatus Gracilibacteria bacterium]|nr:hypothetical protein [Candidatus Gracilibacteria bacterium]